METLERQNLDAGAPLGAGSNLGGAYGGDMGRQYLKDMYKRGRISKQEYKALRRKNKLPYETYTYQNYPGQAMGPFGGYSGRIESLGGSMSGQCGNSGLGGGLGERGYGGLGGMGGLGGGYGGLGGMSGLGGGYGSLGGWSGLGGGYGSLGRWSGLGGGYGGLGLGGGYGGLGLGGYGGGLGGMSGLGGYGGGLGGMSGLGGYGGLGGGLAERRYDIGGGPIGGLGTMGGMEAMGAGGMGGLEGGMMGRPIDENRFFKLPHYGKINENPNIDNSTLWRPRADIFEIDHGHMRVEFELPGVPREDISLTIQENILTLAALKPQTRKEEVGFHYQNERHFGKFYRRIMLPFSADPNKVKAQMDNGVLKVDLVRVPGSGTGRIPIHEGLIGSSTSMGASAGTSTRV